MNFGGGSGHKHLPRCSTNLLNLLCGKKGHDTAGCYRWKPLSFDERQQKIKDLRLCFRCLKENCPALLSAGTGQIVMQIARVKVYDDRHRKCVQANVFFFIPAAINHMFLGNLLKKLSLNMKVLNMSHMCLLVQGRLVRGS